MSNDFYQNSGYPGYGANGDSASARSELALIEAGFNKLPTLTASAGKYIRVNAGSNALESVTPAATEITNTPSGTIAATTVQAALNELAAEKVQQTTLAAAGGAGMIGNTPAGNIAGATVQAALNELDTEKEATANKSLSVTTDQASNVKFPSVKAVYDWAVGLFVSKTSSTGSAILPTGTTAQRDGSPVAGYTRFNSDYDKPEVYNGTAWTGLGGATGAGGDDIFYENGQTVTTSYTITTGKNALTAGPVTIADGATVTIPDGSTWSIV